MAWREGRASRRRLALIAVPIVAGVAALVAIHSFSDAVRSSVRRRGQALIGADLALRSGTPFSPKAEALIGDLVNAAGGRPPPKVARVATFGAMARTSYGAAARLVQVTAVEEGYPFYGVIETVPAGHWKRFAAGDDALVEPAVLTLLDAKVGDTLILGEARLAIAGTVSRYPGDLGVRTAFGPRVFIPARLLANTGLLGVGSRVRYEAFVALPSRTDPQALARRFRSPLAAQRVNLATVEDDQRRLDEVLGRLSSYLALVALIALLMGGVGVASGMNVFAKQKTETVAVLRCLGATTSDVFAIYVFQAAVLGLLGSVTGAALGTGVQRWLPSLLRSWLPVDVQPTTSIAALASGIGVGLWTAVAFALLPLLALRRVSPLVALRRDYEPPRSAHRWAERGLAAGAIVATIVGLAALEAGSLAAGLGVAAGLLSALGGLWLGALLVTWGARRSAPSRLSYTWRQGLANLHRPANQTTTVVLALGFGAFLLCALVLIQNSLLGELRTGGWGRRPNMAFIDVQPDQAAGLKALLAEAGVRAARPVPIVAMRIQSVKGTAVEKTLGVARTPEGTEPRGRWALRREYRSTYRDNLVASERGVAGRFWEAGAWKAGGAGPIPISLDTGVATELDVRIGDELVWDVQGVSVTTRVAHLRQVEWARFEPNFFAVFPEGPLESAPQTFVTVARVEDAAARGRLQRLVMDRFPNVSALDLAQIQEALEGLAEQVGLAIRFMALFSLAAGGLVLLGAVAATRLQRIREAALLKTLGATRGQVRRIAVAEYVFLGGLAALLALALSWPAAWVLLELRFETPLLTPWGAFAGLGALVMALTLGVGLSVSAEAFRRTPLEILRAD